MTALEILKNQQKINEKLLEETIYDNLRADMLVSLKVRQLIKTKRLEQVAKRINKSETTEETTEENSSRLGE